MILKHLTEMSNLNDFDLKLGLKIFFKKQFQYFLLKKQMQLPGDSVLHKLKSCVSECCLKKQSFLYFFALQQSKQLWAGAQLY